MRPDRMTTKSREAFQDAIERAGRFGNPEVQPEHLLAAMLAQEGGVAAPLLQKAGADVSALAAAVDKRVEGFPRVTGGAEPGLSRRTLEMLRKADDEAKALKDDYVSVEHYVLAAAKHDREVAALLAQSSGHRRPTSAFSRPSPACEAASASPTATPRGSSRPSRSTAAT